MTVAKMEQQRAATMAAPETEAQEMQGAELEPEPVWAEEHHPGQPLLLDVAKTSTIPAILLSLEKLE